MKEGLLDLDDESIYESAKNQSAEDFGRDYDFLVPEKNDRSRYHFQGHEYELEEDIIVPTSVTLIIDAGATLKFSKNNGLVSFGRVIAEGTPDRPITITAKKKKWGVFLIKGEKASGSSFKHCRIEKGGQKYFPQLEYTGALSVYDVPEFQVENCEFRENTGDDALNCKYSGCEVRNSTFEKNLFDAVDFDFSQGLIEHNLFQENRNHTVHSSL